MDIFDQIHQEETRGREPDIFDRIDAEAKESPPLTPLPSQVPIQQATLTEPTEEDRKRVDMAREAFDAGGIGEQKEPIYKPGTFEYEAAREWPGEIPPYEPPPDLSIKEKGRVKIAYDLGNMNYRLGKIKYQEMTGKLNIDEERQKIVLENLISKGTSWAQKTKTAWTGY
jgi:hypothetical protein